MARAHDRWETHWDAGHNWALVLAAGDGSRLHALTTTASGVAIPKQFCSLGGGGSLFHDALTRARTIVPSSQTCAVVAQQHRHWWQGLPLNIPPENLIQQPANRGTANGILLPLLRIVHRDPDATLLVLPSDHFVRNEEVLASSLRDAVTTLEEEHDDIVLLGITPEEPDPELGYIVADGAGGSGIRAVSEFVEKPDAATARDLIARGGAWNSFIFAAHARTLLRAFEDRCCDLVSEMRSVLSTSSNSGFRDTHLADLYLRLPVLDFSRDILQRSPSALRVLTVPSCGWSDLGTPRRVMEAVRRRGMRRDSALPSQTCSRSFLDLAAHLVHVTRPAQ